MALDDWTVECGVYSLSINHQTNYDPLVRECTRTSFTRPQDQIANRMALSRSVGHTCAPSWGRCIVFSFALRSEVGHFYLPFPCTNTANLLLLFDQKSSWDTSHGHHRESINQSSQGHLLDDSPLLAEQANNDNISSQLLIQ